jgi:hypothetical protein
VLDEVARVEPLPELRLRQEVVIDPVLLAGPRRAGGGGDRQLESRNALAQRSDERALAYARRAGYDENLGIGRYRRR